MSKESPRGELRLRRRFKSGCGRSEHRGEEGNAPFAIDISTRAYFGRWLVALGLALGVLASPAAWAQDNQSAFDPRAVKVLRRMSEKFAHARQVTMVSSRTVDPLFDEGAATRQSGRVTVLFDRLGRFFETVTLPDRELTLSYDGQLVSIFDSQANAYGTLATQGNVEVVLSRLGKALDFRPPMAELVASDPYQELTKTVRRLAYLGKQTLAGRRCHHLASIDPEVRWDLWISVRDGLPVKLAAVAETLPGQPTATMEFTDINLEPHLADDLFAFQPPAGAIRAELALPQVTVLSVWSVIIKQASSPGPGPELVAETSPEGASHAPATVRPAPAQAIDYDNSLPDSFAAEHPLDAPHLATSAFLDHNNTLGNWGQPIAGDFSREKEELQPQGLRLFSIHF